MVDETGPTPEQWARQEELERHLEAVKAVAGGDPTFTDVGIDDDLDGLVIYATRRPSTAQWEACERAAPGVRLRFAKALLSDAQRTQLFAVFSLRWREMRAGGVHVVLAGGDPRAGPDGGAGPFIVFYEAGEPTAEMISWFDLFGPGTVEFRRLPPGSVRSLGSAASDVAPVPGVVA